MARLENLKLHEMSEVIRICALMRCLQKGQSKLPSIKPYYFALTVLCTGTGPVIHACTCIDQVFGLSHVN